jgi:hypothetical protein
LLKTIFLEPENTAKEAISCLGNWQRQKEPVNKPLKIILQILFALLAGWFSQF